MKTIPAITGHFVLGLAICEKVPHHTELLVALAHRLRARERARRFHQWRQSDALSAAAPLRRDLHERPPTGSGIMPSISFSRSKILGGHPKSRRGLIGPWLSPAR